MNLDPKILAGLTGNEEPGKPWYQSKTILGIAIFAVATIAQRSGLDLGDENVTAGVTAALQLVGAGVGIYGRVTAKHTLTK